MNCTPPTMGGWASACSTSSMGRSSTSCFTVPQAGVASSVDQGGPFPPTTPDIPDVVPPDVVPDDVTILVTDFGVEIVVDGGININVGV